MSSSRSLDDEPLQGAVMASDLMTMLLDPSMAAPPDVFPAVFFVEAMFSFFFLPPPVFTLLILRAPFFSQ